MPARNTKSITKPSTKPYTNPKTKPIKPNTLLSLGLKRTKINAETPEEKNQRKKAENEMKKRYAYLNNTPKNKTFKNKPFDPNKALALLDQESPSSSLPEIGQSIRKEVRFANGRFPARTKRRSRSKDPNYPKDNISLFKPYKALLGRSSDNITTIDSLRKPRRSQKHSPNAYGLMNRNYRKWPVSDATLIGRGYTLKDGGVEEARKLGSEIFAKALREAEAKVDAEAARNIQRIARGYAARAKKGKNGARMAAAEVEAALKAKKEPEVEKLVDKMKRLTLSNSSNKKRRMGALLGANKALRKQKKRKNDLSNEMNIARNDKA